MGSPDRTPQTLTSALLTLGPVNVACRAAAVALALATGCGKVGADGFPASVDHACPDGFFLLADRCYRHAPAFAADGAPSSPPRVDAAPGVPDVRSGGASSPLGQADALGVLPAPVVDAGVVDGSLGPRLDAPGSRPDVAPECPTGNCELEAVSVTGGEEHTCAALLDGRVRCWGENSVMNLGISNVSESRRPLLVPGLTNVRAVAAGEYHTCALLRDGSVSCWGANDFGELGYETPSRGLPTRVNGVEGATAIASGKRHTCAVVSRGAVQCWGKYYSQVARAAPVQIPNVVGALGLAAADDEACAVLADGSVRCWGGPSASFLEIGVTGVITLAIGDAHRCATSAARSLRCWGSNFNGQLGLGPTMSDVSVTEPVQVRGLTAVTAVSANTLRTCAVDEGAVLCWGKIERFGEPQWTPAPVIGIVGAVAVSVANQHTCAIIAGGAVRCWGENRFGQLGNGSLVPSTAPVAATFSD